MGEPKAPTSCAAHARLGPERGGGAGSPGSRSERRRWLSGPAGNSEGSRSPAAVPRAAALLSPPGTHHPIVPLPHGAALSAQSAAGVDQARAPAEADPPQVLLPTPHPVQRAAPRRLGGHARPRRHLPPRRRGRRPRSPAVPRVRLGIPVLYHQPSTTTSPRQPTSVWPGIVLLSSILDALKSFLGYNDYSNAYGVLSIVQMLGIKWGPGQTWSLRVHQAVGEKTLLS